MIKNRVFALVYRLIGFGVALFGVIVGSEFNRGIKRFLFYTGQTNLLVCVMFFVLCVCTIWGIYKDGARGSACYFPRFSQACSLCIFFTLVVFWCVLAPFFFKSDIALFGIGNIVTHTLTPLLAIFNCVLFCDKGHIKKRDVLLWSLMPTAYIAFAHVLSLVGITFYSYSGIDYHYPYFFMDFELIGFYSIVFTLLIGAIFVFSAFCVYKLDKKWQNRTQKNKN